MICYSKPCLLFLICRSLLSCLHGNRLALHRLVYLVRRFLCVRLGGIRTVSQSSASHERSQRRYTNCYFCHRSTAPVTPPPPSSKLFTQQRIKTIKRGSRNETLVCACVRSCARYDVSSCSRSCLRIFASFYARSCARPGVQTCARLRALLACHAFR